mgnify:FL=1|jgi:hypothetical protein|tara:strand:- start:56 stop:241 length:186 start_codon:yes stop_codon:yes gene_type:complete
MKSDKKEEFISSMTDIDDISSKWRTDEINWDRIQRIRFANADAEIDPEDSYSRKWKKELNE